MTKLAEGGFTFQKKEVVHALDAMVEDAIAL